MNLATITEHAAKSARHTTSYLAAGPVDGPLILDWEHRALVGAGWQLALTGLNHVLVLGLRSGQVPLALIRGPTSRISAPGKHFG